MLQKMKLRFKSQKWCAWDSKLKNQAWNSSLEPHSICLVWFWFWFFVCLFVLFTYSWFTMWCRFLLHYKVTQSFICTHSLSYIIFHQGLSQGTGYSFLCCTVGPHCLSILNEIVCIYQPQTPCPSHIGPYSFFFLSFFFWFFCRFLGCSCGIWRFSG